MGSGNQNNPSKTNSDQKSKKADHQHIHKVHIGLTDILTVLLAAIFLGLGGILATDQQFRWPSIFFFTAGVVTGACGIFLHVRHRIFNKRTVAFKTLLGFFVAITCLITLACSQWWSIATKEDATFNVIVGPRFFNPPEGGMTAFVSAEFFPKETILHPINQLLFMQITNRTHAPRRLAGVSIELAEERWWVAKLGMGLACLV